MEQGPPPRTLLHLGPWLRLCKVWCRGVCCRSRRVARPAAAFLCVVALLSLTYLTSLVRSGGRADVMIAPNEFARRAAPFRIAERLNGADGHDKTSADTRLSASVTSAQRRRVTVMKKVQNGLPVHFATAVTTVDRPRIAPSSAQVEVESSKSIAESDENVSKANRSSCGPSAPSRWEVDYASRAGVRCDLLLAGERSELLRAEKFLNDSRGELSCSVADSLLAAASCDDLRAAGYGKPMVAESCHRRGDSADDDGDTSTFRLAFGIRLHRCAAQAELLLRSIYEPQHLYCLHVDGKASADVLAAVKLLATCLPNILIAPPDNDFLYGSVSQLHADLTCMQILLDHDRAVADHRTASNGAVTSKWRYFLNVAGQELPLRRNAELVALLRAYNGSNDIASQFNPNIRWRYASKIYCKLANGTTVRCSRSDTVPKDAPPGNVTVYKGVSYGFFSRALVEYALRPGGFGAQLYDWIADTWAPDEQYFATLVRQPDAPGGYREYSRPTHPMARAVKWSGYRYDSCHGVLVRGVCVLGVGDLRWLAKQSEAFANKFDYERDPLAVQCLVRHTLNSSRPLKPNVY